MAPPKSETKKKAPAIDRAKLRTAIRNIGDEYVFYMLDDAIEALPPATLAKIVGKYIPLDRLRPDAARSNTRVSLTDEVKAFDAAARSGDYYVSFNVNSRNCMELSTGTRAFVADCGRLLDRCVAQCAKGTCACEAFEIIATLLRYVDEGNDDVVFFADEGGSWQVGADWATIFPAWFKCLVHHTDPDEFARVVVGTIDAFEAYARAERIAQVAAVATPEQRRILEREAGSHPGRRGVDRGQP